ncbi:MAG: hypothetical protein CVU84_03905 [Firmicutes bacterium HGW-Firmicutes-1]|jgi:hypothetical protein|nr:MAG: hypothetical protein CVU84_03905 [Firmicutes bacterium HGW-Firmicutes-1]
MKSIFKSFSLLVFGGLLLATIFFTTTNVYATNLYGDYAEKLKEIGVFKGTSTGFELDREPTRIEAAIMFVRLIGAEQEALDKKYKHPFIDVPKWADEYIGYLYHEKLTKGTSTTTYGSDDIISARGYITFILRALGYSDAAGDFTWNQSLEFAKSQSLIIESDFNEFATSIFYRDQLAKMSYLALKMPIKGDKTSLVEKLVSLGAIDKEIATKIGLLTLNSADEQDRPNPTPNYSDWDASVQIYIKEMGSFVGTAIKANGINDFLIKSKNSTDFTIIGFNSISLNEALDSEGNVLAYVATEYVVKEDSLVRLNGLVKEGAASYLDLMKELSLGDFITKDYGTKEAPDKTKFKQLRQVHSYNIIVLDNSGKKIPLQLFLEVIQDAADLS